MNQPDTAQSYLRKALSNRIEQIKDRYEFLLALFTWSFVSLYTFNSWLVPSVIPNHLPEVSALNITLLCSAFFLYLLYMIFTDFYRWRWPQWQKQVLIITLMIQCGLMLFFNIGLTAILLIIYLVRLVDYGLKPKLIIPVIALPLVIALIKADSGNSQHTLVNGLAFTLYNAFAYLFAIRLHSERQARAQSANLLRELKATQSLRYNTIARDERLRIARDLHDTLGHHLTGLSIQLEVASHCKAERAAEHVSKAQQITRLLLSDVRNSVSTLREQRKINLTSALQALCNNLPQLEVKLRISPDLEICNAQLAGALFRAVQEALTNCMKHSTAE
ncbi:sensor histidine kinase [Oceanospirillum linum]|uniref:Signal transduction histidine kinase subgroup 3 dimerisation and phosphoacceptor domain-containing protein n=1 Tax=Oceanospirillum linum TaxID=966 RepID=A0A1T1HCU2_OCELI|nr:histidine kinase [Oceanospirillum linum]OOV87626.1 hypothetical protein BTA35_0206230 [Oceanospirillum linum]SEF94220.1 Signal transduction histidine kinase [Oleiphilus messinensis]SMP11932.1 Signal transduction histidine kinase [Oceanospirillum linum]